MHSKSRDRTRILKRLLSALPIDSECDVIYGGWTEMCLVKHIALLLVLTAYAGAQSGMFSVWYICILNIKGERTE